MPSVRWAGYREKATESLSVGLTCLTSSRFNGAANRLYWASFLAVAWAIATIEGKGPADLSRGHTGWNHTLVAMNLKLVLPGPSNRVLRARYKALKALREKADYAPEGVSVAEIADYDQRVRNLHASLSL